MADALGCRYCTSRFYTEWECKEHMSECKKRPTPVAPISPDASGKCGELETAAWKRKHPTEIWMDCREEDIPHYWDRGQEVRELSPRSQAEELLAAKDEEIAAWIRANSDIIKRKNLLEADAVGYRSTIEHLTQRAEKAEADNAAQAARIKELEAALDSDPSGSDLWRYWSRKACEASQKYVDEVDRAETLEAKLAAAEKALDELSDAKTELNSNHDYSRGWNDALFRVRQIARAAREVKQ